MHSLHPNLAFNALTRGEKVFLETWYTLTHARSLDSFRVRCHNGRTILHELQREMGFSFTSNDDLAHIVSEAKQLCCSDTVLRALLGPSWKPLETLLGVLAKTGEKDTAKDRAQLAYILLDTLEPLCAAYLQETSVALQSAITKNDDAGIVRLTNAFATDLAARGWALSGLHQFVSTQFLVETPASSPFSERFRTFTNRLMRGTQPHEVTFFLSGNTELQQISDFSGFRFSAEPPDVPPAEAKSAQNLRKFLRRNPLRTFATTTVDAVDNNSAVHAAYEKFAKCLDRLRFNFCPQPVLSLKIALVARLSDHKRRIVNRDVPVPNPEHHVPFSEFMSADQKINRLFDSGQVNPETRRRIEAASRHYRLGLDSHSYRDMLLNWWMGLETLTNGGDGKNLGDRVIKAALPLLTQRYFRGQLTYVAGMMHSAVSAWPVAVQTLLTVTPGATLSWQQALAVLQDPTATAEVDNALSGHPSLQVRWVMFHELATQPKKLASYLDEHEQRVSWHLERLYRFRCCLVHGTPVVTPLQLPTANLEYYLRECIYLVLDTLLAAPQIPTLEVIFERAKSAATRRRTLLTDSSAALAAILPALETSFIFPIASP